MMNAIIIDDVEGRSYVELKSLDQSWLADNEVDVSVDYSSLNYKDALAITGHRNIVRRTPLVAGIDFAGIVTHSKSPEFTVGDRVLLNGFGAGENLHGGLATKAKVKAKHLIKTPKGLSTFDTMAIGTAGYTAMLCVMALEKNGVMPSSGPVLVTGANGGVGTFAISLLSKLGYRIVASTGRKQTRAYLARLGCNEMIHRDVLNQPSDALLEKKFAGAIDTLGSHTLANVCASLNYGGTVAACGLAQGTELPLTVMPFILRGINLAGVDSVYRTREDREAAWSRLAALVDEKMIAPIATKVGLHQVIDCAHDLLAGKIQGRIVVDVNRIR